VLGTKRRRLLALFGAVALPLASAAALLARSAPVSADESPEPIRIVYRAPAGCPDEASFTAMIRGRTSLMRFASPTEPARTFEVSLRAGRSPGRSSSGRLTIRERGRDEGSRDLDAATCADVADAIALVVALAIDPRALAKRVSPATESALLTDAGVFDAEADAPLADAGPVDLPVVVAPPPAPTGLPEPSSDPPSEPSADASPHSPRRSLGVVAGVDFSATTGVAPSLLFGPSPYLGWRFLRLSFVRSATTTFAGGEGSSRFTWTVGRIDACPLTLVGGTFRASACARVESGELEADGITVKDPRDRTSGWLALGPLVRAEWSLLGPLFLDAEGVVPFRVTADRFYLVSGATVERVPIVGVTGSAGLGVHFL
jgi:hypothetical protein